MIEPSGGVSVEVGQPFAERFFTLGWRDGDEVVVVVKDSPRLEFPTVFFSAGDELGAEVGEAFA